MLHYHVWFNLKPGVAEEVGISVVRDYLVGLATGGDSDGFQLLRNSGRPPRSKLPAYHALVEFVDSDALDAAMKKQAKVGIHTGNHGRIVDVVCDFHVEIFTSILPQENSEALYGCEI